MPHNLFTIEGNKVLYVDYRGLSSKGIIELSRKVDNIILEQTKDLIFIINVTDVNFTTKIFAQLMAEKIGELFSKNHKYVVFIGITGMKKIMLNVFSKMYEINAHHKTSEEEAINFIKENIYTEQALRV